MKILVIRFSSIGDIVLTTPVVRCLKQQLAGAEVHFLTKYSFHTLVENNPYIDQCHYLDKDWDSMIRDLKAVGFDYIIDLHHNLRTLRVKRALKVKSVAFDKLNVQKWLLTNLKIDRMPNVHIVDRYLDTVKELGVQNDGKGLDYFIPQKDITGEKDIPVSHQAGYIGIVIGAALATKKMPLHKLRELCGKIDHPIILLGGKEDVEAGNAIASLDPIKIYNACGKFNLNESADLVRKAKLIISHDTGLMHVAAAFQKPVLSVWGNTVPAFGMYPYYGSQSTQTFSTFEISGLRCRPCSKIGYKKCPKGHFKCMEQMDLDAIAAQAREKSLRK